MRSSFKLALGCTLFLSACDGLPLDEQEEETGSVSSGSCLFESFSPSDLSSGASFKLCLEFSEASSEIIDEARTECSSGSADLENASGIWSDSACTADLASASCTFPEESSGKAYVYNADFNFVLESSQGSGLCGNETYKELISPEYKTARVQVLVQNQAVSCIQIDKLTEFSYEFLSEQFSASGLNFEDDQTCSEDNVTATCLQEANEVGVVISQYYYTQVGSADDIASCQADGGTWKTYE